jgi:DNA (cytosine-5)-methyltransferase 1
MPIEAAALYNEIEPYAAAWLRNLIALGEIPDGVVDERSIVDLRGDDLAGCDELHFFAGIGVWARAVAEAEQASNRRLARPLFTGSCPCQPLSSAGQRQGHVDERHLWPAFHRLIAERRPATILGEQVASKDGREWMAAVRHDLEASGYAVGTAILPAGGFGAPHIRYRMFFVADAEDERQQYGNLRRGDERIGEGTRGGKQQTGAGRSSGRLADAEGQRERPDQARRDRENWQFLAWSEQGRDRLDDGATGGLADAAGRGASEVGEGDEATELGRKIERAGTRAGGAIRCGDHLAAGDGGWPAGDVAGMDRPSSPDCFWSDADWIFCRDGKWRPTQSSILALAHGTSPRLGRMRAEEIDDPDKRSPAAFLRSVREEIGEKAFFERIGGLLALPRAEVLRSSLYGAGNGEGGLPEPQSQPVEGGQDGEAYMRNVREGRANARSSSGPEPKEQRAIELDDVMSFLSSTAASPLVDASAFKSGGPYEGMSRAGMLRGYGNTVVLPVARAFVECAMEALDAD